MLDSMKKSYNIYILIEGKMLKSESVKNPENS